MKKFLMLSLLGLFSLNAYANNCAGEFQPESGSCRIVGPDGRQIIYNSDPPQSGGGQNVTQPPRKRVIETTIIHKASKYGALALDEKTSALGGAINSNSLSEAKKAAIRQCGEKGCKVITWVRNGCIAAAGGKAGKYWKLAKAAEPPGKAEPLAMKRCQAMGVSDCQIVIPEACSVPDGMYD